MPREKYPYSHEDISFLAKSLKNQLAGRDQSPGHVELLNMLAKATGHSNYQSWLADRTSTVTPLVANAESHTRDEDSQDEVEIIFRVSRDGASREVFERDSSGNVLDRRHQSVSRIFAHFDVGLRIAGAPESVVRFRAVASERLLPAGEPPEKWLLPYLPRAIASLVATSPARLGIFGSLDVSFDALIAVGPVSPMEGYTTDVPVRVARLHHDRLVKECELADQCSRGFERVKEVLWEIFGISSSSIAVQTHRSVMSDIARYLRDYLEAEGDMFMGAWNQEKLGRAARLLEHAVKNPRKVDQNEWQWARRDVYTASPPKHWERSVLPPATLFELHQLSREMSFAGAESRAKDSTAM